MDLVFLDVVVVVIVGFGGARACHCSAVVEFVSRDAEDAFALLNRVIYRAHLARAALSRITVHYIDICTQLRSQSLAFCTVWC